MDKICIDCKYFEVYGTDDSFNRCTHHSNASRLPSRNLVTGEAIEGRYVNPPHLLRSYGWLEARLERKCGAEGRYYIPRVNKDH